jgi:hypothetical protein
MCVKVPNTLSAEIWKAFSCFDLPTVFEETDLATKMSALSE